MPQRITINGGMFRKLAAGEEVEQDGVKIIFADIGFDMMRTYISWAEADTQHGTAEARLNVPKQTT